VQASCSGVQFFLDQGAAGVRTCPDLRQQGGPDAKCRRKVHLHPFGLRGRHHCVQRWTEARAESVRDQTQVAFLTIRPPIPAPGLRSRGQGHRGRAVVYGKAGRPRRVFGHSYDREYHPVDGLRIANWLRTQTGTVRIKKRKSPLERAFVTLLGGGGTRKPSITH